MSAVDDFDRHRFRRAQAPGRAHQADGLRILYVSARYPPFVGGTEIHTAEVASRMARRGHDVTVLTTAFEPLPVGTEVIDGVNVVRLRAWPADYDLYITPAVYKWITARRWDIIHCQGYHTLVAPSAMAAAVASHQPLVVTFHSGGHSSFVRRSLRPLQQAVLRPLFARADRLIGVSKFETDFFRRRLRLPASKFETVTNGVSLDFLEANSEVLRHGTRICSVGRLERYKGHHRVIAALPEVRRVLPDVTLQVIGDGPYRRHLEALARRLGVSDIVHFTVIDPRNRRQMADMFTSSHLVTLLSDYESQGVVGLEAIAVGRPLLIADGTALAELGRYGDVSIVPPNVDGQALGWLIANKIQQDLTPSRQLVPMWEHTVDELTTVYDDVFRQRGGRNRAAR